MRNRLDTAFLAAAFASIATCVGAAEPPAAGVFAGMWLEGDPAQFPGADIFGQVDDGEPHHARGPLSILGDRANAPVAGVSIGKGTRLASGQAGSRMPAWRRIERRPPGMTSALL